MQSIDDICMHAVNSTVLNKERRFSFGFSFKGCHDDDSNCCLIVIYSARSVNCFISLIDFFQLDFSKMFLN